MATRLKHYAGLMRDSHDPKDLIKQYNVQDVPSPDEQPLVDLRKYIDHVYDQGKLGSTTANAVCAAYKLLLKKQAETTNSSFDNVEYSRLFLYYNSRCFVGNTGEDTGAPLRDALKVIHGLGVCKESFCPYNIQKFAQKPSDASYGDAVRHTISKYERLGQHVQQFRACLKDGFPFAFGFKVYNSFRSLNSDKTGMLSMPSMEEIESDPEPDMLAALAVGYNDETKCITVLNSWGESFGDRGYFYMPYDYISDPDQTFDFWKIGKVTDSGLAKKYYIYPFSTIIRPET